MTCFVDRWMVEHPAWLPTEKGARRVVALPGRVLVDVELDRISVTALDGEDEDVEPSADVFSLPVGSPAGVPELADALGGLGAVGRLRNPSLWEAVATAILRQVIQAGQSKRLFRLLSATHGERVPLPDGDTYALFPTPETILDLPDEEFSALGLAFKREPLRAAARALLDHGDTWTTLAPADLLTALQSIPRVGPWTAGAAVADATGDWSLYPYGDLAVRTWAGRAAPSHTWFDTEAAFTVQWRHLADEHLSPLTLLTLAWGSHHGDIG